MKQIKVNNVPIEENGYRQWYFSYGELPFLVTSDGQGLMTLAVALKDSGGNLRTLEYAQVDSYRLLTDAEGEDYFYPLDIRRLPIGAEFATKADYFYSHNSATVTPTNEETTESFRRFLAIADLDEYDYSDLLTLVVEVILRQDYPMTLGEIKEDDHDRYQHFWADGESYALKQDYSSYVSLTPICGCGRVLEYVVYSINQGEVYDVDASCGCPMPTLFGRDFFDGVSRENSENTESKHHYLVRFYDLKLAGSGQKTTVRDTDDFSQVLELIYDPYHAIILQSEIDHAIQEIMSGPLFDLYYSNGNLPLIR